MSEPPSADPAQSAPEAELDLRRTAGRGFAIGGVVAAAVFGVFALAPATDRPLWLYVGLAVVLWVSVGLFATAVLLGWRVRTLARAL